MNTPWWVRKNDLICVISPALFPVLTGWCSASVWERTNLELQVMKSILFATACQGLQN